MSVKRKEHSMSVTEDARVMDQTWFFVYTEWHRLGRPVRARDVITFVSERTPPHHIQKIIDLLVQANFLDRQYDQHGMMTFTPRVRRT